MYKKFACTWIITLRNLWFQLISTLREISLIKKVAFLHEKIKKDLLGNVRDMFQVSCLKGKYCVLCVDKLNEKIENLLSHIWLKQTDS